jgi:ABC-2 type transport system ATP-binding protein
VSDAAIEVSDLHKRYGEYEAVRGIDIEVRRGEVFGLLGPNGAGKTTTVEILEGYRARTSGEVSVLGYDPARRAIELRRQIGIVLQSGGIYSHVTPREALRHWASFYPHPREVGEVLELAGLQEQADVRSRKLSGGQLRRLDFALALVGDPELIFLDEPTTGFDPEARRAAWETVRSLRALGKTILLTTHYLDEAQALADRVAIVKEGRVLAIGPPRELGVGASHYRVAYRNVQGELVEHETDDPTGLLHTLTEEAMARGERLEELTVGRPSLEDVYLELTADVEGPAPPSPAGGGGTTTPAGPTTTPATARDLSAASAPVSTHGGGPR